MAIQTGQNANASDFISTPDNTAGKVPVTKAGGVIDAGFVANVFTLGETVALNDALYFDLADGKVYRAQSASDKKAKNFIGFAKKAGVLNDQIPVQGAPGSIVSGFSGLTANAPYYLSTSAGAITATTQLYDRKVGIALSSTTLLIQVSDLTYAAPSTSTSDERSTETTLTIPANQTTYLLLRTYTFAKAVKALTYYWNHTSVGRATNYLVELRRWDGASETIISAGSNIPYTDATGPKSIGVSAADLAAGNALRVYGKTTDTVTQKQLELANVRYAQSVDRSLLSYDDLATGNITES